MLDMQKDPIIPSKKDVVLAEESREILASYIKSTKTPIDQERLKILEELTEQAQKLNMGY